MGCRQGCWLAQVKLVMFYQQHCLICAEVVVDGGGVAREIVGGGEPGADNL